MTEESKNSEISTKILTIYAAEEKKKSNKMDICDNHNIWIETNKYLICYQDLKKETMGERGGRQKTTGDSQFRLNKNLLAYPFT